MPPLAFAISSSSTPPPPRSSVKLRKPKRSAKSSSASQRIHGWQPIGKLVMRILGLDVGERRIGVALSDPLGLTAQRLTVLTRQNATADLEAIRGFVEQHGVGIIVVGLPLTMRGERGVQARRIEAFVQRLRHRVPVPVQYIDERLTTVQGERALIDMGSSRRRRKQLIDQVAAQLILQQFLDSQQQTTTSGTPEDSSSL